MPLNRCGQTGVNSRPIANTVGHHPFLAAEQRPVIAHGETVGKLEKTIQAPEGRAKSAFLPLLPELARLCGNRAATNISLRTELRGGLFSKTEMGPALSALQFLPAVLERFL